MSEENKLAPTPADLERVKAEHKRVYEVEAGGHVVLCRGPKRVEWNRFLEVAMGEAGKRYAASKTLFSQCLVHPSSKEFERVCDDEPVLESALVANFVATLQSEYEGSAKKLLAVSSGLAATSGTPAGASTPFGGARIARRRRSGRCSKPTRTS